VACLVVLMLAIEGLYCLLVADSIKSMFQEAQNVQTSDPLPHLVWWYVAAGCLWLAAGIAYVPVFARLRHWLALVSVPALVYGLQEYRQISPFMLSWTGIFHGDLVALETASAVTLCLLGVLTLMQVLLNR
jgi:hypothetical protein